MPTKTPPPPLSTALTLMRVVQNWPQNELAARLGCGPSLLSDYEAGRKSLSRERLVEIAAAMGLPADALDQTLAYIQNLRLQTSPEGGPAIRSRRGEAAVAQVASAAEAFARSVLALGPERRAEEDRWQARVLWDRLKGQTPAQMRSAVERSPELQSWALCELVCERSLKAAADRADRALELAGLAARIAELAPGEAAWRHRLQGYALAHLANARRVAGDLPAADETFVRARSFWQAGASADLGILEGALVLGMEASLRREQRRLPEALALLDQALAVASGVLRNQLLVNKANFLELASDYQGAIDTLRTVTTLAGEEPRLGWLVHFTLANNLLQAGRPREAETLLLYLKELANRLRNDLDSLRLHWLEGRVAAAIGHREDAVAKLSQVREDFCARKIAFDTALVTLELAVLYLEERRLTDVRSLARQMLWIFQTQGVHREALSALKLFCEAAEKESLTLEMVRNLVAYLHRARHDPSLQFKTPDSKKTPLVQKGGREEGAKRKI